MLLSEDGGAHVPPRSRNPITSVEFGPQGQPKGAPVRRWRSILVPEVCTRVNWCRFWCRLNKVHGQNTSHPVTAG